MWIASCPRQLVAPPFASLAAVLVACGADPTPSVAPDPIARGCIVKQGARITVTSLGPGMALGVNESGQVAGTSFATLSNDGRATLWNRDGSVMDAGSLGGSGYVFDVNDLGAAAGVGSFSSYVYPFHAVAWNQSGEITDLGAPGGDNSRAMAINNLGQIVGDVEGGGHDCATLWEPDGTAACLGTLGGPLSGADDISDAGHVVGWSNTPEKVTHAFLWTPNAGMQDLGTLGGSWSGATGINDLGHVTGWSQTAEGGTHAFLWRPQTGMVDLDPLGTETYAEAINNRDEIVGYHYPDGRANAFFWSSATGMIELGTLGGEFSRAWDLNENGVVVGDSTAATGGENATVWTFECDR